MKRYFFYILTGILLLVFMLGTSSIPPIRFVQDKQSQLYDKLRTTIEEQISLALNNREVKIGSVSGPLLYGLELNDVAIANKEKIADGTVFSAKKVKVYYNVLKIGVKLGDVLAGLNTVDVEDPKIYVQRDRANTWNVLKLLTPPDPKKPQPPLTFRGKVIIKNGSAGFIDERGFGPPAGRAGKAILASQFETRLSSLAGTIDFGKESRVDLDLNGVAATKGNVTQGRVSGFFGFKNSNYAFEIKADKAGVKEWGSYILNIPRLKLNGGAADVGVKITSINSKHAGLPVKLSGGLKIKGGSFNLFGYDISKADGKIRLGPEEVVFDKFKGSTYGLSAELNGRLYDFSDLKLDLKTEINGLLYGQPMAAFAAVDYKDKILKLNVSRGALYKGGVAGKLKVDFSPKDPNIAGDFKVENLDLNLAAQKNPDIYGKAGGVVLIEGRLGDMAVKTDLSFNDAAVFRAKLVSAGGLVEIQKGAVKLSDFVLKTENGEVKVAGQMDAIKDPLKHLNLLAQINLKSLTIREQTFEEIVGKIEYRKGVLKIPDLTLFVGPSLVSLSGELGLGQAADFKVEARDLDLSYAGGLKALLPEEMQDLHGTADIRFEVAGMLDKNTPLKRWQDFSGLIIEGEIAGRDVLLSDQKINQARLKYKYADNNFKLEELSIKTDESDFNLSGSMSLAEQELDLSASGKLNLQDLSFVTRRYGRISGVLSFEAEVSGPRLQPDFSAKVSARSVHYNAIELTGLEGDISWKGDTLSFPGAFKIISGEDEYALLGSFSFNPKSWQDSALDLSLKTERGKLKNLVGIFAGILSEVKQRQLGQKPQSKIRETILPIEFRTPPRSAEQTPLLYDSLSPEISLLNFWTKIKQDILEQRSAIKEGARGLAREIDGYIFGSVKLEGTFANPAGSAEIEIKDVSWRSFQLDWGRLSGRLEGSHFWVTELDLYEKKGRLWMRSGEIDLKGKNSFRLEAKDFPIDFASAYLNLDEPFAGRLDLILSVDGALADLKVASAFELKNGSFKGIAFDSITGFINYAEGWLNVDTLELVSKDKIARLEGRLPVTADGEMALDLNLYGPNVGLITAVTNLIVWQKGDGQANLKISGRLTAPVINGKVSFSSASVNFPLFESRMTQLNAEVAIEENLVTIKNLEGNLSGKLTYGEQNRIKLSGEIDLSNLFKFERLVNVNLKLDDTQMSINLPDVYKGEINLEQVSLAGPLSLKEGGSKLLEEKSAPTLSGNIAVKKAVLFLPRGGGSKKTILPLNLDLKVKIEKESKVVASEADIGELLSKVEKGEFKAQEMLLNINLVIAEEEEIEISGTLKQPSILGEIVFSQGLVNLLNKEFILVKKEDQDALWGGDLSKVSDNKAVFEGGGVLPNLTLTAKVEVKNIYESETAGSVPKAIVISRFTGRPYALEEAKRLQTLLTAVDKDTARPLSLNESQIQVLLLPEFVQDALRKQLGLKELETTSSADVSGVAKDVARDYLKSAMQNWANQVIGRQAKEVLGLESLIVEYDFGKEIDKYMPRGSSGEKGQDPLWKVALEKQLFPRLRFGFEYALTSASGQTSADKENRKYKVTYTILTALDLKYYQITESQGGSEKTLNTWELAWQAYKLAGSLVTLSYIYEPESYLYTNPNSKGRIGAKFVF